MIAQRSIMLSRVLTLALTCLLFGCNTATGTETPIADQLEQISSEGPLPELQVTFNADRPSLQPGECAMLQWEIQGGEITMLDGVPVDSSGEKEVCPPATTTYTLAVYVGVGPPAPPQAEREVVISVGDDQSSAPPATTTEPPLETNLTWVRTGGPPGGLGYDIRYNFNNPDIWYVTDAFAGVHVSTDNGLTWHDSNTGIPGQFGATSDGIPIFCLTVDPINPQILWAGTQNTGHIYKSTDGGQTWQERDDGVTIEHDLLSFRGFTIHPNTSDVVYAMAETTSMALGGETVWSDGIGGVIYKTTDGGEHWEEIWDGGMPSSLARYMWIDTRGPEDVLYVSTGIFDRGAAGQGDPETDALGGLGVLKSTDGGKTWDELNEANGLEMLYIGSLYMHPDDPDILLAAAGHVWGGRGVYQEHLRQQGINPTGVYRTTDGGEHWSKVLDPPLEHLSEAMSSVELCPSNPNIAYAGSNSAIYRSEDAGLTWEQVSGGVDGWGPPGVKAGWPIDLQCDPHDTNRVFSNNYGGGNFLSEDGGRTWQNASQGYTGATMASVEVSPVNPARAYAAARSGGWYTDDGGTSWYGLNYPEAMGGEWYSVWIHPDQPDHLLVSEGFGSVLESTNGGASWNVRWSLSEISSMLHPDIPDQVVTTFAASDPTTIYAALCYNFCSPRHEQPLCQFPGAGVIVSRDGGTSWQRAVDENLRDMCVIDLAVVPNNVQTVYAAAVSGLFKTTDGGTTWTVLNGLPEGETVRAVAVDPADTQHVLAGVEGLGVYSSTDGGGTWQPSYAGLEANNSLHDIVFDPTNSQVVYTSDHFSGVYRSIDGGLTWVQINDGLRTRSVNGLSISTDGQHLYAATDGEGVFRLDVSGQPPSP
jgi:photosystem II stability/assembly factor-like uncharacterized protein